MLNPRNKNEIVHFSQLSHIWWGAKTYAGQERYDDKLRRMIRFCRPKKGVRILEIGCGDGEFTKRLATLDARIIGTDITPAVIKRGNILIKNKKVKLVVGDSEKMEFKTGLFDIVCGVSILHHLDVEKCLRECYRVLKPGGQIFFTEPNLLNPNIFFGLNILWLRAKMEYSPNETALTRWKVEKLLKRIKFKKASVNNYDFLHPSTPRFMVKTVKSLGFVLEKIPLVKEISGSLIIWAKK